MCTGNGGLDGASDFSEPQSTAPGARAEDQEGRNEAKELGGAGDDVMDGDGLRRPKRNAVKPCRFKPARRQFTPKPKFTAKKPHTGSSKPFLVSMFNPFRLAH